MTRARARKIENYVLYLWHTRLPSQKVELHPLPLFLRGRDITTGSENRLVLSEVLALELGL